VVQEGVRNVVRHANAGTVTVSLRGNCGDLELAVRDDGVGFDVDLESTRSTLGLVGMRERVHLVGGHIDIQSEPDAGTSIFVRVSVKQDSGGAR
jgi:signal transduction histidine kinase